MPGLSPAQYGAQQNDFLMAQPWSQAGGFPQVFNLGGSMGSVVGYTTANPAGGNPSLSPYFASHVSQLPYYNPNATPITRPDTTANPRPGSFGNPFPNVGSIQQNPYAINPNLVQSQFPSFNPMQPYAGFGGGMGGGGGGAGFTPAGAGPGGGLPPGRPGGPGSGYIDRFGGPQGFMQAYGVGGQQQAFQPPQSSQGMIPGYTGPSFLGNWSTPQYGGQPGGAQAPQAAPYAQPGAQQPYTQPGVSGYRPAGGQPGDFAGGPGTIQQAPQLAGPLQASTLPEGQRLNQQAGVPQGVAGGFLTNPQDVEFLAQNGLIQDWMVPILNQVASRNQQAGQQYAQNRLAGGSGFNPVPSESFPHGQYQAPGVSSNLGSYTPPGGSQLQGQLPPGVTAIAQQAYPGAAGPQQAAGGPQLQSNVQDPFAPLGSQPASSGPSGANLTPGGAAYMAGSPGAVMPGARTPFGGSGGSFTQQNQPGTVGYNPALFPQQGPLGGNFGQPSTAQPWNSFPIAQDLLQAGPLGTAIPGLANSIPPGYAGFDPNNRLNWVNYAAGPWGNDLAGLPGSQAGPLLGFSTNATFSLAGEQQARNYAAEQEVRNAALGIASPLTNPALAGTYGTAASLAANPFTTSSDALQSEIEGLLGRRYATAREGALQGLGGSLASRGALGGESSLLKAGTDFGSRAALADALAESRIDQAIRRSQDYSNAFSGFGQAGQNILNQQLQPTMLAAQARAGALANPFTTSGLEQVQNMANLALQEQYVRMYGSDALRNAIVGGGMGLLGGVLGGL